MSEITLGIIGGGQLGSMLAIAAKKLNVKTVVFCDDIDAPAQNFCNQFVTGSYDNKEKISEFINQVDLVTYEFENIPYETLNEINKFKPVLPKPSVNRLIQHRLAEKDFVNKLNIRTTRYVSIEKKSIPLASLKQGHNSLELIIGAMMSAQQNKTINFPIKNKKFKIHSK